MLKSKIFILVNPVLLQEWDRRIDMKMGKFNGNWVQNQSFPCMMKIILAWTDYSTFLKEDQWEITDRLRTLSVEFSRNCCYFLWIRDGRLVISQMWGRYTKYKILFWTVVNKERLVLFTAAIYHAKLQSVQCQINE